MALWAVRFSPLGGRPIGLLLIVIRLMGSLSESIITGTVVRKVPPLIRACSEWVLWDVVVAREVMHGEATVVTIQGSRFRVVSSRDSALINWGWSNTC